MSFILYLCRPVCHHTFHLLKNRILCINGNTSRHILQSQQIYSSYYSPAIRVVVKRHYAKVTEKIVFEMNPKVTRDTAVFSNANVRFFRYLTVFGIAQFIFWLNLASISYAGLRINDDKRNENGTFWDNIIGVQQRHKYRIAVSCIALGGVVLFFTGIYPLRTVSNLTLLKGGDRLQITTYSHFGRTKQFTVALDDVSCTQTRQAQSAQMSMKVRNRWFFYLLDKRTGLFHDGKLFDHVIGLNRSLK